MFGDLKNSIIFVHELNNMKMEDSTKAILKLALDRAKEMNHGEIRSEHIMVGLVDIDNRAKDLLVERGVNIDDIGVKLVEHLNLTMDKSVNGISSKLPSLSKEAKEIIDDAQTMSKEMNQESIKSEFILLSILKHNQYISYLLIKIDLNELKETIQNTILMSNGHSSTTDEDMPGGNKKTANKPAEKSKTPILDNFSIDLCQAARDGQIDPIVGRSKEIERVAQILSRRRKNNPVLIGEPGCVLPDTKIKIRKVSNKNSHRIHTIGIPSNEKSIGIPTIFLELDKDMETIINELFCLVNIESGSFEIETPNGYKPIGDLYLKYNKECVEISLTCGKILKGSIDHLVETIESTPNAILKDERYYINLKNIQINDAVITKDGVSYVLIKEDIGIHDTYDLEVLDTLHQYVSNGINSHNTGKSAIVEGLAKKIVEGDVPQTLIDKRVMALSLTSLVSGTKYRGQFEERLKALIDEVKSQENIIIFIDEIHTIMGAGNPSGNMDAANILKPVLARGDFQCIGATTMDEYRESIENDGALERRFQKVIVEPPTPEETRLIVERLAPIYGDHHNVTYTEKALDLCVILAARFITDRYFPDKAIDIMDEAGARCQIKTEMPENMKKLQAEIEHLRIAKDQAAMEQEFEAAAKIRDEQFSVQEELDKIKASWKHKNRNNKTEVDENKIREVVSMMSGVPVEKCDVNDAKKYLELENTMKKRIINQDEALTAIAKALRRSKTAISNTNKPLATLFFCGPTGTGKTETAKTIADEIFGPNSLIRIDMSEYQERHTVSKLIGAPPGYVGYGEGGDLTEKVRRKPFCVVLFDEIEKAHPDVFNTLLQVLDEGFLSDRQGRKVNFRNTIIIMTSNIGIKKAMDFGGGVGFKTTSSISASEAQKKIINKELRDHFPPEFLNRIQEIVTFNTLTEDDIKSIIKLQMNKLGDRIKLAGYGFKWNENVIDYVFKDSYEPEYGARPVDRAIQHLIEDAISEEMLRQDIKEGSTISLSYSEDKKELKITVKK